MASNLENDYLEIMIVSEKPLLPFHNTTRSTGLMRESEGLQNFRVCSSFGSVLLIKSTEYAENLKNIHEFIYIG